MAVVSDSSPLILLAKIGRLSILREVSGEVLIPPAVRDEVVAVGPDRAGADDVAAAEWVKVRSLRDREAARSLAGELGLGEAEAIALAQELGGEVALLMDDRKGRRLARERGLHVVGTAGLVVLARERGLIPSVRSTLDELRSAGLYLGDSVYRELLTLAGEATPGADDPGL